VHWLESKSRDLIRASRRPMKDGVSAFPPQAGSGYDAFWLRDYTYALEGCAEALTDKELRDACRLFVKSLRGDGDGVDCVRFDGTPIYQPDYGTMGTNPVADGSPFTVDMAWQTYSRLQDKKLLAEIIDPLLKTIAAVPRNPKTHLVHLRPEGYDRCPYGFTDSVRKQGDELFCSLLLIQADRQLAEMLVVLQRDDEARKFRADADRVAESVRSIFWDDGVGLFRAATIRCREPDIWGSAFAVYLGVATDKQAQRIAQYFQQHHHEIVQKGQSRHLPGGVYWEIACPKDTYQNGGYWATPVGWFIYALDLVDPKLADQTLVDLVNDFQQRGVTEWVFGEHTAVPNYLSSATLPLAGAKRMQERRNVKKSASSPEFVGGISHSMKARSVLARVSSQVPGVFFEGRIRHYGFLFSGTRVLSVSGVDYQVVRAQVSLAEVLELLGFVAGETLGDQVRGACPIHASWRPSALRRSIAS
jgi:hypothetical protein